MSSRIEEHGRGVYTPGEVDALARLACETVVAEPGKVCAYDIEAYRRIDHRPVKTGGYPCYNPKRKPRKTAVSDIPRGAVDRRAYSLRIGGFRREGLFGPDEAAKLLSGAGIDAADSLGHGLFEHLVLCREYGVTPSFEAPAMGIPMPFLEPELDTFQQIYREHVREYCGWIKAAEAVYGHRIIGHPGQPWVLWGAWSPLALFLKSAARKPEHTADELKTASGTDRLTVSASTPVERAQQAKAWAFIRRRHMRVRAIQAAVLREALGDGAVLIDNTHTLPVVDYELLGEVYDHPGVAVRPGYLDEPGLRTPYVGYSMRLFADLTGKTPIASIRINTLCAGTRVIPGPEAIRAWCDEAIAHGVAGFYFWPTDYPSSEGQYFGALAGNPDPSAMGPQRWDAMLDIFRDVAGATRYVPPGARVGILVPDTELDNEGWGRVMRTFIQLDSQRVFVNLIAARAVQRDAASLDRFTVLLVPALPFMSDRLKENLERYVNRGGGLVLTDPQAGLYDTEGKPRSPLFGLDYDRMRREHPSGIKFGSGQVHYRTGSDPDHEIPEPARQSAVFDVTTTNVREVTGQGEPPDRPKPDPGARVRHYMYEHSSSAIMPYIDIPDGFPDPS
jgi:hypothetical protein